MCLGATRFRLPSLQAAAWVASAELVPLIWSAFLCTTCIAMLPVS